MSNLLIIAQNIDENDDHRGFFIDWLKEFAKNFDSISVITLARGSYSLPQNVKVYSLGKEHGASKLVQAARFYRYLIRLVPSCDGIFAHASAIFVIASWPVAKIFRKKIILWYLHKSLNWRLKLAKKLADNIATANRESLMFDSSKIVEVGHGINLEMFRTDRNWLGNSANIISVGRISPIKGLETLIESVGTVSKDNEKIKAKIIGQPVMPEDDTYLLKLKKMVSDLNIGKIVEFGGFVPYKNLPAIYKEADISVNLTPRGGIDKAVLESMASGLLVLTSNEAFKKYFAEFAPKLIFRHDDPSDLADKLKYLISLSPEEKKRISEFLVRSVKEHHTLERTIGRLSDMFK